jgi:MFS family permease
MNEAANLDDAASSQESPSRFGLGREFWMIFAASFALNFVANLFVMFPLWLVDLGGAATTIGAVIGTGSLAALAARPGVGVLMDRSGLRLAAVRFLIADAIALSLYLPLHSIGPAMFAVRAIHGAIEGTARVALFAMVYEVIPRGREGHAMATFSLCGMGPAALGPIVGEELIHLFGFGAFFVLSIALVTVSAAIAWNMPDDRPRPEVVHASSAPVFTYAALIRDRKLVPLWIVTLAFSLSISPRLSFLAPYAYQIGLGRIGWYFTLYSVAAVAVRLGGGVVMDRVGLTRLLTIAMAVLAVGIALLAGTRDRTILALAAIVGGISHGYVYPALSALIIARTPAGGTARSSSIYGSLYDMGGMVGPYALGAMASALGYAWMFVAAGMFAMGGAGYFASVGLPEESE